nr:hypothetical protein [Helicobacter rodentium]
MSKIVRKTRETKEILQPDLALKIGIKSVSFYSNCECCRESIRCGYMQLFKSIESKRRKTPLDL